MADSREQRAALNTDREIWRAKDDYYSPSIHVTEGRGIGINVGGTVYVRPVEHWHKLASQEGAAPGPTPQPLTNPDLLAAHWLFEMRCNHELKTDVAFCACGWAGTMQPSVGMAAKEWATHVLLTLAGVAATVETPQGWPKCKWCKTDLERFVKESGKCPKCGALDFFEVGETPQPASSEEGGTFAAEDGVKR